MSGGGNSRKGLKLYDYIHLVAGNIGTYNIDPQGSEYESGIILPDILSKF